MEWTPREEPMQKMEDRVEEGTFFSGVDEYKMEYVDWKQAYIIKPYDVIRINVLEMARTLIANGGWLLSSMNPKETILRSDSSEIWITIESNGNMSVMKSSFEEAQDIADKYIHDYINVLH